MKINRYIKDGIFSYYYSPDAQVFSIDEDASPS